jgi:hypothetical protein
MTDEPLTPGSLPPEEQPRVKEFDPAVLDRAVIAIPLLKEMEEDLQRIELVRRGRPDALKVFNAAIEYSVRSTDDPTAAYQRVKELADQAAVRAQTTFDERAKSASSETQARETARAEALKRSIEEQQIEPPFIFGTRHMSFARLHAAVIRRLLLANERLAPSGRAQPISAIYPHRFQVIIDLNLEHPGGRTAARDSVIAAIGAAKRDVDVRDDGQEVQFEKDQPTSQYLFARLEARVIQRLVELDLAHAFAMADERRAKMPPERQADVDPLKFRSIFRIWPDFPISACINRSIATVKADAAHNSFSALGDGITWAVMDSGIDKTHPHFKQHRNIDPESTFHRDFTVDGPGALKDDNGHGTHVAGIIGGQWLVSPDTPENERPLAVSRYLKKDTEDVEYQETRLGTVSGMAPRCKLVSLRVLDENGKGQVSNLIAAINYIQEINGYGRRLLIHGVNLSVGYNFEPEWFACGQSPLCVEVDRLVRSGVVVVVAAGNTGYGTVKSSAGATSAGMALTINDPGNADLAITVGATHRDMPHVYGVSYFSSKGPTGDGRMKPDLVAPGEKIISCATGELKQTGAKGNTACNYVETSGTSMAAPHVSGVIAAFLSVRGEFIGQPERIKQIFVSSATDLRRDRYFQGAGLVDLMRAIQSV